MLAFLAAITPDALAGTYVVTACGASPGGVNNSWVAHSNHGNVTTYATPCAPVSGGLIARAAANASSVPSGTYATWNFNSPNASTVITRVDVSAEIFRLGGDAFNNWGVGLYDETGGYLWGGAGAGYLHVGTQSGSYIPIGVNNRAAIAIGALCLNGGGCSTASSGVQEQNYSRARTALYGARVTLSNGTSPVLWNQRGGLWSASGWISGTQDAAFDSADDVGIKRVVIAIDSDEHANDSACDYTRPVPCPGSQGYGTVFNTTGFSDGAHTLTLRATDTADNSGSDSRTIYVDNNAPGAPATPQLSGTPSETWRTVNGFTLTYSNPSTAGGSANASSDAQVCAVDEQGAPQMASCSMIASGSATGSNTFNVPSVGKFKARVRVHDALYTGAWSDWGPVLRFDNVVPGEAIPQVFNGWLSKAEVADGMTIEPSAVAPKPASGIAGYAIRNDGQLPNSTISAVADQAGRATVAIDSWADGVYTVKARTVSVAGLSAANVDVSTSTIKIDTTSPHLTIDGAPAPGSTVKSTTVFDVEATDALSGMTGASLDRAATAGAYLAYTLDGNPEAKVRGGTLRLTALDGLHTVKFSAVDVAGNRSAEQTFTFTQDTTLPQGGLLPGDPADPRRIGFFVAEDCIASATVELSTNDGATWRPLDTEIGARLVTARVPDDVWDARQPYTVRAQITDCAGNKATLDQWYGGAADGKPVGTLVPPQRIAVKLIAAFTRLELAKTCTKVSKPRVFRNRSTGRTRIVRRIVKVCPRVGGKPSAVAAAKKVMSRTREVHGVLTDATGKPLAGREVHFQTQAKMVGAPWQTIRVAQTDTNGLVKAAVRKFTSLRIRLVAPRDEAFADGTSETLITHVAARSTIKATPRTLRNGDVLTLTGRVQGGQIPSSGMQIALYGFSPSKKRWLPVRTTVKVDPRGSWTAVYRFTATGVKATYRFRVRIAERATFPFATGNSRTVKVAVRP